MFSVFYTITIFIRTIFLSSSNAWEDEMGHAAIWLAYAVGSSDPAYQGYLNDAKGYVKPDVPWAMSWSEKTPGVQVSLVFSCRLLVTEGRNKIAALPWYFHSRLSHFVLHPS